MKSIGKDRKNLAYQLNHRLGSAREFSWFQTDTLPYRREKSSSECPIISRNRLRSPLLRASRQSRLISRARSKNRGPDPAVLVSAVSIYTVSKGGGE
jgi:hypothetical protein